MKKFLFLSGLMLSIWSCGSDYSTDSRVKEESIFSNCPTLANNQMPKGVVKCEKINAKSIKLSLALNGALTNTPEGKKSVPNNNTMVLSVDKMAYHRVKEQPVRLSLAIHAQGVGLQVRKQHWESCNWTGIDKCRAWEGWTTHFPVRTVKMLVKDSTGKIVATAVQNITSQGFVASEYKEVERDSYKDAVIDSMGHALGDIATNVLNVSISSVDDFLKNTWTSISTMFNSRRLHYGIQTIKSDKDLSFIVDLNPSSDRFSIELVSDIGVVFTNGGELLASTM